MFNLHFCLGYATFLDFLFSVSFNVVASSQLNNVSKNSNKKSAMPKIAKSLFVFQVLAINEYVTMNKITTTILKPHDIIGTATGWKSARK